MNRPHRLAATLAIFLFASSIRAQDANAINLAPQRFSVDNLTVSARPSSPVNAFADSQRKSPRLSKTKLTMIIVGAGAVVAGILLTRGSSSRTASPLSPIGPPTTGTVGSTLVINGVPQ